MRTPREASSSPSPRRWSSVQRATTAVTHGHGASTSRAAVRTSPRSPVQHPDRSPRQGGASSSASQPVLPAPTSAPSAFQGRRSTSTTATPAHPMSSWTSGLSDKSPLTQKVHQLRLNQPTSAFHAALRSKNKSLRQAEYLSRGRSG